MTYTTSGKRCMFRGESASSASSQYRLLRSGVTGDMAPLSKMLFPLPLKMNWSLTAFVKLSQLLQPILVLPFSEFLQQECLLRAEHLARVNPWATEPGGVGRFEMEGHHIPESHRNNVVIRGEAYKQRDTIGYTRIHMSGKEVKIRSRNTHNKNKRKQESSAVFLKMQPGELVRTEILRPHCRPPESQTLRAVALQSVLTNPLDESNSLRSLRTSGVTSKCQTQLSRQAQ